jgi:hypothetical protein
MADDARNDANDPNHYKQSAQDRAHGTHGKGDARETLQSDALVEAGNAGDPESAVNSRAYREGQTGNLSDAARGNAPSGGSVIDRRPPERKKGKKGS